MIQRLNYTVRILFLLLYASCTLSPIYISATAGCSDVRHEHARQHLTVGIVWVNVALSALLDDPADGAFFAGGQTIAEPDTALILVSRKRAVLREQQVAPPPLLATCTLQDTSTDPGHRAYRVQEVPLDLKHRESDGYSTLHAGLSPPTRLS